jgi:hypothetical protein
MELIFTNVALFATGAFLGALVGRIVTFGVMAVAMIVMMVLK